MLSRQGDGSRIEEAIAEAGANFALYRAYEALHLWADGTATMAETLAALTQAGMESNRVLLSAGWDFLDKRAA